MRLLTIGTFDPLHVGHVELFAAMRRLAGEGPDAVYVGVNGDEFVARIKRRPPVMPGEQRRALIEACRSVDMGLIHDGDTRAMVVNVKPDFMVLGMDWATKDIYDQWGIGREWLAEQGIGVLYVDHAHSCDVTSTMLRQRMGARGA